jgi:beta-N-acetylglucosaminidase
MASTKDTIPPHPRTLRGYRKSISTGDWWINDYYKEGWHEDEMYERKYPAQREQQPSGKVEWGDKTIPKMHKLFEGYLPF